MQSEGLRLQPLAVPTSDIRTATHKTDSNTRDKMATARNNGRQCGLHLEKSMTVSPCAQQVNDRMTVWKQQVNDPRLYGSKKSMTE
jgi:hypothetical protein